MSIIHGHLGKSVSVYGKGVCELPDGEIIVCGSSVFSILDKDMYVRVSREWVGGSGNTIMSAVIINDNRILLVGSNGKWEVIDFNGVSIKNGVSVYNTTTFTHSVVTSDNNILIFGYSGCWQLFTNDMVSIKSGVWSAGSSAIFDATVMKNTNLLLVGASGYIVEYDKNMNKLRHFTWPHGAYTITRITILDDGNIFCAGDSHYSFIRINESIIESIYSITWAWGTSYTISDIQLLPNGNIFLIGASGYMSIVSKDTYVNINYTNVSWYNTSNTISSVNLLSNGKLIILNSSGLYSIGNIHHYLISPITTPLNLNYYGNTQPATTIGFYSSHGIVDLDNGELLMVGASGNRIKVYSSLRSIGTIGQWIHGSNGINAGIKLNNGNVLLMGGSGLWQIVAPNGISNISSGSNLLGGNAPLCAVTLPNNNIVVGGTSGKWALMSESMSLIKNGVLSNGEVSSLYVCLLLLNGDILLAGVNGRWELFDSNMNPKKNGIFMEGSRNFMTGKVLNNGNVVLGVNTCSVILYNQEMEFVRQLTVETASNHVTSIEQLNDGNLLVTYNSNNWKIISSDLTEIRGSSSWDNGVGYSINTTRLLSNKYMVFGGTDGRFQITPPDFFMYPSKIKKIDTTFSKLKNKSIIELPSGRLVTFDSLGKWYVLGNDMSVIKSSTWIHNQTIINTILLVKNKFILLAGNNGKWELYDTGMNSIKSGTWNSGTLNIHSSSYISSKGIILAGQNGTFELFDPSMTHISTHRASGWNAGEIITDILHVYHQSPEETIFSGSRGVMRRYFSDLSSNGGTTWIHGMEILTHIPLYDSSILTVGDSYRSKNNINMTSNMGSGQWGWGAEGKINTVSQLLTSRIFLGGDYGNYEIINQGLSTITKGKFRELQHTNIISSFVKSNGDLVVIGEDGTTLLFEMGYSGLTSEAFSFSKENIKDGEIQTLSWDVSKIKRHIKKLIVDIYKGESLYSRKEVMVSKSTLEEIISISSGESKNNIDLRYSIRAVIDYVNSYYISNPMDLQEFLLVFFTALENVSLPQPNNIFAKENIDTLRTKANEFRTANGLSPYVWTDPTIIKKSTPVKAIHMNEIQNAITEVYTQSNTPIIDEIKPVVEQEVKPKDYNFPIKEFGNRLYNIIRALKNQ